MSITEGFPFKIDLIYIVHSIHCNNLFSLRETSLRVTFQIMKNILNMLILLTQAAHFFISHLAEEVRNKDPTWMNRDHFLSNLAVFPSSLRRFAIANFVYVKPLSEMLTHSPFCLYEHCC